jgi:predicted nucleotidyltransferase component of viral defense system
VRSQIAQHPKVWWRTVAESGQPLRIKIEINTHERSPALPVVAVDFQVRSNWWTGSALIRTFQLPEMVATKLRALYQRTKGRDLFDIWLALTIAGVDTAAVLAAFSVYRPLGYTAKSAIANLRTKLGHDRFRDDMLPLLAPRYTAYEIDLAADLVIHELLEKT